MIADNSVQNPACLLGIDEVLVDLPRVLDAVGHHIFGNFVECHTFGLVIRQREQLFQMPGDCFPFTVRVRSEKDGVCLFGFGFQIFDHLCLIPHRDIFRFKRIQVYTKRALGEIPQMAHRCLHLIISSEILLYRFCLGW